MNTVLKHLNQRFSTVIIPLLSRISVVGVSVFLLWLFTCSALIGISLGYTSWFIPKTPLNLMLGFMLLIINLPIASKREVFVFGLAFLTGMIAEWIGVHTQWLFGEYSYGGNLGFKVYEVPIIIGIYWAVLVAVTSQIARVFSSHIIIVSFIGASLMVLLDFSMEQMSSTFDFWHFSSGIAGLENYVAWFFVGFILHLFTFRLMRKGGQIFSFHLYANQLLFFVVSFFLLRF